ncbi:putative GMC oxidoreductase [Hypoxylon sp. FL1284]|nr:putative GMC oxidoreductase [Hypoxylon sp. FL1284]
MDKSTVSSTFWDYIFVGGGLTASVVSHRLGKLNSQLKILVVEAGPDANKREDIVWPNSSNLIGGDFDWKDNSVKQAQLDGRVVSLPNGRALGGGTVINAGGWVRGDKYDYDLWGKTVGDPRWSYDGLLPFMKKSESFWSDSINRDQHGFDGPAAVQSVTSTKREFPLRDYALRSWAELGVTALPGLDANAGNPLGVGELQENKNRGRREIASGIYSLENVTVLTDTLVEKVLIESEAGRLSALGVRLADGTEIRGRETILAAGAIRSPQVLMLSGVGPADKLAKAGIPVLLDQPEVGKTLCDHGLFMHSWKVKDPSAGWALGSGNPLFTKEQYGWGGPVDFLATTDVPKEGLAAAIAEDEGRAPDPATHPLLDRRTFAEHVFMYFGAADGSRVTFVLITMLPTARGSVGLVSADVRDAPLVDPNFLGNAVDRYAVREALRTAVRFAGSDLTAVGRVVLDGEVGAPGFDEVLLVDSTDEYLDARLRAGIGSSYHSMGTLAMGKVVDADLKVKGVDNLAFAAYATAEQAVEIIYDSS